MTTTINSNAIERVLIQGDLSAIPEQERVVYYNRVCESLGLNPLTQPFAYIKLNGKLKLYALREATEQLRKIHNVSIRIVARELVGDVYVVTAQAAMPNGRTDESIGAVNVAHLQGENLANAFMKAETKAKRRVTLSVCGLAMMDENEVESIPHAVVVDPPQKAIAPAKDEFWRSWKTPEDAIQWGIQELADYGFTENFLREKFGDLPEGGRGKAWIKWVQDTKKLQGF